MRKPLLQDDAFLADVTRARAEPDRLHLWWLGQSGFLVLWRDEFLLLDPYLSDSLTLKYATTDKPHTRLTERVVAPGRLGFVNAVTSSHNHTDHLDGETLAALLNANPSVEILVPEANRAFAADRLGVAPERLRGINTELAVAMGGFTFHAVPAAHNELETDAHGCHRYLGYVVEAGSWTFYHSGDTLRYPGMAELLRCWKIDLALLPINGDKPERRVAGNLDGREAAILARDIGAGVVIPCHYDLFEFNTASPEEFAAECRAIGQPFCVLGNGGRWSSPPQVAPAR